MTDYTDNKFNTYMGKFKNLYFVKIDQDGCRYIGQNSRKIAPYLPEKQLLGIWCTNMTTRMKKSLLNRLKHLLIEVHQDCDNEFGAFFHEKDLDAVAKVIKAKRRMKLTEKERQARSMRAKKFLK